MTSEDVWEAPNAKWVPIAQAPFHFRRNVDGGPGSSDQQIIEWFGRTKWKGQTQRCELAVDRARGVLEVGLQGSEARRSLHRPKLRLAAGGIIQKETLLAVFGPHADPEMSMEDIDNWITSIGNVWRWIEYEFLEAVAAGEVRIFARLERPTARKFTEIPADAFRLFTIKEWGLGSPASSVAEGPDQIKLHGIYVSGAVSAPIGEAATEEGAPGRERLENPVGLSSIASSRAYSPYMQVLLRVAEEMDISPQNQPKKIEVEAAIKRAWDAMGFPEALSGKIHQMMATILREPESQKGRGLKPMGGTL